MRLASVEHGHRPLQKLQLALIRGLIGHVPGPILVMSYRRALFGTQFSQCLEAGMRKGRAWTQPEREIFAAFVSKLNSCSY
jgi:hypothetical protein